MSHIKALTAGQPQKNIAYLTFRTGNQWYALEVLTVFEVSNMVAISSVPDMPTSVLGMVNIRGVVVPVIDLRKRFNIPDSHLELTTPIIFLDHPETSVYGVVVDDVDDVINLNPSAIGTTSLNQRAKHIRGLTDYHGRLIMILDPVQLLHTTLSDEDIQVLAKQG